MLFVFHIYVLNFRWGRPQRSEINLEIFVYIYIYVWKLNQTVLELDVWADKFLFFPPREIYTFIPLVIYWTTCWSFIV